MAGLNEEARIPVYIDDEQAVSALRNLQSEASRLRGVMADALQAKDMKGWDEADKKLKRVNKEMDQLKKEAFDVDKVMGKLASASVSDLEKALRKVTREWKAANQGSKEAIELDKKRTALQGRLNEVNGKIVQQQGALSKLKDVASGLLPAFGWGAIAAGAGLAFKKIIASTDELSTKWEIFTGGLREGMNAFFRTMATNDWSNFFTNIENAIRAGREYAAVLDDLEAKQRTMTVAEADALEKKRDLLEKVRNAELSREDRIKAGEELIALEERLAGMRTKIQKEGYDNEMMMAMNASKLSKERIEELIKDFDSGMKAKAEAYNNAKQELDALNESEARISARTGRSFYSGANETKKKELSAVINSADQGTKEYADDLVKLNNATDNLLDKTVAAYKGVKEAENSAYENTARVRTQVHSMTAKESKEEEKASALKIVNIGDETDAIKQEAEALKIMKENLAEAEKLMLEGGEEEFRKLVDNIEAYGEVLKNEHENLAAAAEPIDLNFATPDQMQASFDARMALIEEEYEKEKEAAMGNHAAILAAERNYNKNVYDLKSELIDAEYSVVEKKIKAAQSYLSALTGIVSQESALGKALFLFNQGLAVGEVWVNIAKANAVATALSPMTLGQPWVTLNTARGVKETALIAAQTVARFVGKKDGGYTDFAATDDRVVDYVHSNEFVASANAVRNPTVKPVLDLIDMAQRSGRIANLNLPAALGMGGRRSGGYAGSSGTSAQSAGNVPAGYTGGMFVDPRLIRAIERMNEHLDKGIKTNFVYREFEDYQDEVAKIRDAANM